MTKSCYNCARLQEDGVCAHYNKIPPQGFGARCSHFEQGEVIEEPAPQPCDDTCNRFDQDDQGGWCLLYNKGGVLAYRPVRGEMECPLRVGALHD
jgi:hypothetical protein